MSPSEIIIYGCIGGLLPDVLRIIANRYSGKFDDFYKHPIFWLGLIFLVAIGGFCSFLFQPEKAAEALALGYSAPKLLSDLVATPGRIEERSSVTKQPFTLMGWWRL